MIEDCNKRITNPNGVLGGITVRLVIRSNQEPPTLYNILKQVTSLLFMTYCSALKLQNPFL
jgi:hypothetical protein